MIEQGSPEWHAARVGKATASRVSDIIARTKSGPATSRANYMAEKVAERLTGVPYEGFQNNHMLRGIEQEPAARAAYEFFRDTDIELVGIVDHPTVPMSSCSPDGYVGEDGLVQIKCPMTSTHLETLVSGKVPGKYHTQIMWELACTGRAWCDFVSYDNRMPASMQLFVARITREPGTIEMLEREVAAFLFEVEAAVKSLTKRYGNV